MHDMQLGNKQLQIWLKQEILRENIPAIKDFNGRLITESIEKASSLNSYCLSLDVSKTGHKYSQLTWVNHSP
jgi:hypothetical protein